MPVGRLTIDLGRKIVQFLRKQQKLGHDAGVRRRTRAIPMLFRFGAQQPRLQKVEPTFGSVW